MNKQMNSKFDAGDLVLGTWRLLDGDSPLDTRQIQSLLESCLDIGVTVLDTAEIYGDYAVEDALGKAFSEAPELRDRFRVVTKAGIDVPSAEKAHARLPHYDATGSNLVASAEKSLRLLGLESIDLFLVHRPDWLTDPEDTAKGLQKLLDEGKVRSVGVSNYTAPQFETLNQFLDGQLATNQVEFSPLHMDPMYDGVFDSCKRLGVRPMAWSPLAQGRILDSANIDINPLRECLVSLREKYDGAGIDALVYAWILAVPTRPSVILGTGKVARLTPAAKAAGIKMERQDWYAIWKAATGNDVP